MGMARLIDADALSVKVLDASYWDNQDEDVIWNLVQDAPTIDAVPVVRCKDCKHRTVTSDGMVCECALPTKRMQDYYIYGSTILARVEADDFCSRGERRSDV